MKQIADIGMRSFRKLVPLAIFTFCLSANIKASFESEVSQCASHTVTTNSEHAFYVGVTDIVFNPESSTYEVTLKVFTDDLELALRKMSDKKVLLDDQSSQSENDALIFAYIENHFALSDKSENPIKLNRVGRETELDVTWIYLESDEMKPLDNMLVSNSMIMEIYEKQSHIVNITQTGQTHSTLLHSKRPSDLIAL